MRIKFSGGWVSVTASNGSVILEEYDVSVHNGPFLSPFHSFLYFLSSLFSFGSSSSPVTSPEHHLFTQRLVPISGGDRRTASSRKGRRWWRGQGDAGHRRATEGGGGVGGGGLRGGWKAKGAEASRVRRLRHPS